jgi:hypothetical protein
MGRVEFAHDLAKHYTGPNRPYVSALEPDDYIFPREVRQVVDAGVAIRDLAQAIVSLAEELKVRQEDRLTPLSTSGKIEGTKKRRM